MSLTIWHPYTQHKTADPELEIERAQGCTLYLKDGRTLIDGISSWWVNPFGHGNQALADAIYRQILHLDQVIFAGFTHQPAQKLATKLQDILPNNQSKLFFSDNGSTAVEVGLKMAIQYFYNLNRGPCTVVALQGSYHGDTFGAMAAGERGKFFQPFEDYVFDVQFIPPPVTGSRESCLTALEKIIKNSDNACFLYEPMVQGAGGMIIHDAEILSELLEICKKNEVICIADEVMTGFGRTGKYFASEYLSVQPDIMCLSKCLTGGILPMALTSCTEKIYAAFHSNDYQATLFHGHSYTGNPVGCAAALCSLELLESDSFQDRIQSISRAHRAFVQAYQHHPHVSRIQSLGTILAVDLVIGDREGYFNSRSKDIYRYFLNRGALLRPLGNTVYILPPYCMTDEELNALHGLIADLISNPSILD